MRPVMCALSCRRYEMKTDLGAEGLLNTSLTGGGGSLSLSGALSGISRRDFLLLEMACQITNAQTTNKRPTMRIDGA